MHINVTVTPDSTKDSIVLQKGRYRITVRAPAQGGQANDAARIVLAEAFGVSPGAISLIKGATHSSKIFLLRE